jgi:hypothetical protein
MYRLLEQEVALQFLCMGCVWFSVDSDTSLNSVNHLIFVMVKWCVLFEVRTELLNNIYTSFGFKDLK